MYSNIDLQLLPGRRVLCRQLLCLRWGLNYDPALPAQIGGKRRGQRVCLYLCLCAYVPQAKRQR